MNRHRWQRRFLTLLLVLGGAAAAEQPAVLECPWYTTGPGDDFGRRGFYLKSYPGTTLKQVTLYISFPAAGTYTLALQARVGGFGAGATSLGRAVVSPSVTAQTLGFQSITFDFGTVAVASGSEVTFETQTVSEPAGVVVLPTFQVVTSPICPIIETQDFAPPFSTFRHNGVSVRITGDPLTSFTRTITIPSVASAHGANNTFFHSDVWLGNIGFETLNVTARYRCWKGQNCGSGTVNFAMGPLSDKTIPDIAGTFFGAPETAGAVELTYTTAYRVDGLTALSRVYTPSLPSPTNGAAVPALPAYAATGSAGFLGLGNNGGDRSAGFRSNAGVYNNNSLATDVAFSLYRRDGTQIGQTVIQNWGAFEARQINDIFAAAGGSGEVTTDAYLVVTSTLPVFSFVTVIDNQTGDSIFQAGTPLIFNF